jgi:hypothetical protein
MSNFKILGAQRVKALTAMLKEQETAAIAEITKGQLSLEKAQEKVNTDLGVHAYVEEIKALKTRLKELSDLVQAKTGRYFNVSENYSYGPLNNEYNDRVNKVKKGDTEKRIKEVQAEFRSKEQRLWLCETLEEAKAIVGIE